MPKKLRIPRLAILILGFVIFSIFFCYGSFLFWKVNFSLNRVVSYLYYDWENLEIDPSEIPVYPNAKIISITYNERGELNFRNEHVSTWEFTTNDAPDTVWKFYVGEMGRKWGFYEWPLIESPLHLLVLSCPSYGLYMTNSVIDNTTYQVTIQFTSRGCE